MKPGGVLNSGNFEIVLFDKESKEISLNGAVCTEYKLYTDTNDLCLFAEFANPLQLIDPNAFAQAVALQLRFFNEAETELCSYKFAVQGFSWETEGKKGTFKVPTLKLIALLSSISTLNRSLDEQK